MIKEIIEKGNSIIYELQQARKLAQDKYDYTKINEWMVKGIGIMDDEAELIDAEGFWEYFKKWLEEYK